MPEQGRAAAKEIGAFYYETSVLTRFGVEETFQNAVRAALCRRRQGRLWSGHFQYVKFPQVQPPFLPPKPSVPLVRLLPSSYVDQMAGLISVQTGYASELGSDKETYYDCVLRVRDQSFLVSALFFVTCLIRMLLAGSQAHVGFLFQDVSSLIRMRYFQLPGVLVGRLRF